MFIPNTPKTVLRTQETVWNRFHLYLFANFLLLRFHLIVIALRRLTNESGYLLKMSILSEKLNWSKRQ